LSVPLSKADQNGCANWNYSPASAASQEEGAMNSELGARVRQGMVMAALSAVTIAVPEATTQELPRYLRDRGPGIATSMFGTYVRQGELLVYPFFEWYSDSNLEYKPAEFGFAGNDDFRGKYRASEGLLFLGYGITRNLAIELEAAVITAELEKSPSDPSAMPPTLKESGLGDVEGQLRWRLREEREDRPELFTYFETVFPFQKSKKLIGTSSWEFKLGFGATRGYPWGTMTVRAAVENSEDEGTRKFEAGEYAIEYLRRFSPKWRVVALIEGNQLDEVELITEAQWHFHPRAFFKLNTGWGLTTNATDFAPEVGIMFSF
jgi:hypothetical protein